MLDEYYSQQLELIASKLDWSIQLPATLQDFFEQAGEMPIAANDERRFLRVRARTQAVGFLESDLPAISRDKKPFGVFTSDFSRAGCGFVSSFQLFPTEQLRLLLPQFWLQLRVVRCRRVGAKCFEVGSLLIRRNPVGSEAFDDIALV